MVMFICGAEGMIVSNSTSVSASHNMSPTGMSVLWVSSFSVVLNCLLSIYLPTYQPVYHLFIYLSPLYLPTYPLSICLSLSIIYCHLYVCLYIYYHHLYVYLSIYLSSMSVSIIYLLSPIIRVSLSILETGSHCVVLAVLELIV